jgi:hypothetical protein
LEGLGAIQREGGKFQIWTLQIVQGVSKNFEKKRLNRIFDGRNRRADSAHFSSFYFLPVYDSSKKNSKNSNEEEEKIVKRI